MNQTDKSQNQSSVSNTYTNHLRFIALVIAVIVVIFAIALYGKADKARIAQLNCEQVKDNTVRLANEIDGLIGERLDSMKILSGFYSISLNSPDVDVKLLQSISDDSSFDFMEYTDATGNDYNITGGISDATDRRYYIDGMKGNIGMELLFESRATHETLLMFYAPVKYEQEPIGVMLGVCQATGTLSDLLNVTYYDEQATVYLCTGDGDIVASSVPLQTLDVRNQIPINEVISDPETKNTIAASLQTGATNTFHDTQSGIGCIAKLPETGWYLIEIFPDAAHNAWVKGSERLTQYLEVVLLLVLVFLLAVISFTNHKDKEIIIIKEEEQKQLLAEARDKAEEANRAKSTFLFNMSHDIRTPMNAIVGFTNLLERNGDDPQKRAQYIKKIQTSNRYLLSLINNVLQMARIESGEITLEESVWTAEQFMDGIRSMFENEMNKKKLAFTSSMQVQHSYILCDSTKIREIFLNIVSNAVKYTPEGGRISMTLTELPSETDGIVLYKTVVSDTGIGMSEEFLPKLFEPFAREQTSMGNKIEGTGLGMPIIKKLIDRMGGTVEVESTLGKGTTFTVMIPYRVASAEEIAASKQEAIPHTNNYFKGHRILLAEDNDLNAEIAIEILTEAGFTVERAEDGVRCVDMYSNAKAHYYDLILMDIQMPNMNGYQATQAIRKLPDQEKANIPILAITANAFDEDKKNAYRSGMNGHIAKPINVPKMMETLSEIFHAP